MNRNSRQVAEIVSVFRAGGTVNLEGEIADLLRQGYFEVLVSQEVVENFLGIEQGDEAVVDWQHAVAARGLPSLFRADEHAFVFRAAAFPSLTGE